MDMAEAEQPDRLARRTTIGDIRQLTFRGEFRDETLRRDLPPLPSLVLP